MARRLFAVGEMLLVSVDQAAPERAEVAGKLVTVRQIDSAQGGVDLLLAEALVSYAGSRAVPRSSSVPGSVRR